ncbi:hypothetical protein PENSPDRAFT_647748 [Peniophora sp. CONT]|nr:hypothetical protein PENSPDRAFT_647748 [Peniophora sp. CONT]
MPHVPSPSATSPLSDILQRLDRARSAHSTSRTSATPPSPPSGARAQLLYKLESLFQYIIAPKARLPSNFDAVLDALDLLADRRASEENMHRAERVLDSALAEVALASAPAPPTGSVPVMEQSSSSKSSKSSQSTTSSSSTVSSSSSSSRRPSQRESMPVSSRPAATPVPFPSAHVSARQSASTPHVPQVQQPNHRSRRPRATSMIYTSSSASASRSGRPRRHASVMGEKRRVHWADAQAPFTLESPASGKSANLALKSPPPRHQDDEWWVLVPSPTDQQHPQPSSSRHAENRSSRHGERRGSEHRERRRSSSRPRPLQDVRNHDHHHKSSRKEHSHSPEKRVSSSEKRRREFSPEKKSTRRKSEVRVVPATVAQPGTPPQAFHPARAMVWPARPDYSSLPSFGRFYKAFPVAPPNTGI